MLVRYAAAAYTAIIYFMISFAASVVIDHALPRDASSRGVVYALMLMALIGALAAASSDLLARIPFPLDGVGGFSYAKSRIWSDTGVFFVGVSAVHLPDLQRLAGRF